MSRHSSVVPAGNGIACLVSTFFKHASTLDKLFGVGHQTPPSETVPEIVFEVLFRSSEHGLLMNSAERHDREFSFLEIPKASR